jgi:glutamine synthetase
LQQDRALVDAFGAPLVGWFTRIKRAEITRFEQVADKDEWQRREYFSRF